MRERYGLYMKVGNAGVLMQIAGQGAAVLVTWRLAAVHLQEYRLLTWHVQVHEGAVVARHMCKTCPWRRLVHSTHAATVTHKHDI